MTCGLKRLSALLWAFLALSACITGVGASCTRDLATGKITCSGEYIPPSAPLPASTSPGERG